MTRAQKVFIATGEVDVPFRLPPDGGDILKAVQAGRINANALGQLLKPKRSKYNAVKTEVDGIVFDSAAEARRYGQLKLLERAGHIRQIELQPEFRCEVNGKLICTYKADFRYFEGTARVVEDVKGVRTPVYRLKAKLVSALYNVTIREVRA